jgi:hypothetical protein
MTALWILLHQHLMGMPACASGCGTMDQAGAHEAQSLKAIGREFGEGSHDS